MTEEPAQRPSHKALAALRLTAWTAAITGVVIVTLLAGVGLAAVLAQRGASEEWQIWSDVGQTFGVLSSIISSLALVAVIITARQNSRELGHQRRLLARTSHANLGMLHQQLLKMGVDDQDLADVWPAMHPARTAGDVRRLLYANMIWSFHLRAHESEDLPAASQVGNLRYLFSSPVMREYWQAAAEARKHLDPNSTEFALAQHVTRICAEYDEAAARHPQSDPGIPARRNTPQRRNLRFRPRRRTPS
ncbi:DUF6082 family protein [Actinoplanes sp. RD1]|uniref:DUF6082 family protein n=1 Tax=Actinoplanes sp. RD1 TaxID=3064538 RepID=UPI002741F615|nr:DUF6082 family protein [Actinoplanes sp. RD1]